MPHDRNGNVLEVGDEVIIYAKVESIQPSEEYCNATVKTTYAMPPYIEGQTITLNTKQLVKLHQPEEVAPRGKHQVAHP